VNCSPMISNPTYLFFTHENSHPIFQFGDISILSSSKRKEFSARLFLSGRFLKASKAIGKRFPVLHPQEL